MFYGVFFVGCGNSGLWILLRMTFEVAVVDNVWCECVAEVVGEFFSLFFVASCLLLSAILIAGTGIIGFLIFFVAFHSK